MILQSRRLSCLSASNRHRMRQNHFERRTLSHKEMTAPRKQDKRYDGPRGEAGHASYGHAFRGIGRHGHSCEGGRLRGMSGSANRRAKARTDEWSKERCCFGCVAWVSPRRTFPACNFKRTFHADDRAIWKGDRNRLHQQLGPAALPGEFLYFALDKSSCRDDHLIFSQHRRRGLRKNGIAAMRVLAVDGVCENESKLGSCGKSDRGRILRGRLRRCLLAPRTVRAGWFLLPLRRLLCLL